MEFSGDGRFQGHFKVGHLKRDTYAQLPDGVEKDKVSRKLLNPLYGARAACKDWIAIIRDLLEEEFAGEATSLGKSVFCRPQRGFGYGYGGNFGISIRRI